MTIMKLIRSSPAPPISSGHGMPSRPSSPILRMLSHGNFALASNVAAIGATSSRANCRTISRTWRCCSPKYSASSIRYLRFCLAEIVWARIAARARAQAPRYPPVSRSHRRATRQNPKRPRQSTRSRLVYEESESRRLREAELPGLGVWYVERHSEQGGREDLALRVGLERQGTAPVERAVQQKIQRIEVRQLVAFHRARDQIAKMLLDALARQLPGHQRIPLRLHRNDTNVRGVALVPRSGVRDVHESYAHQA